MNAETSILLMLALAACIALLGPGLISIEDTRTKKLRETDKSMQQD